MLGSLLDWGLDRSVIGGFSRIGYAARGLGDSDPDPDRNLVGRRVLLTGANSGIGAAATAQLAERGAEVHMVVRDLDRGREARERIVDQGDGERLYLHRCDISDLADVEDLAVRLGDELDGLDGLVHNAGALFGEWGASPQGYERTFALHVLGPFLLSHRLAPLLVERAGRVVFVTSGGAYTERLEVGDPQLSRREFDGSAFYAHAKRAQIVLTGELDRRLPAPVSVHAMHPGWTRTPGVADSLPRFNSLLGPLLRSPEAGADTIVWLLASDRPLDCSGRLWMDRETRPEHRVPWTHEQDRDRALLYERCRELSGLAGEDFLHPHPPAPAGPPASPPPP